MNKFVEAINKIIKALEEAKEVFSDSSPVLQTQSVPETELDKLKNLLYSDDWPVAAENYKFCDMDNEQEKLTRGKGILELMVGQKLDHLNFLDFGCGEGHTAFQATELNVGHAVGYDRKKFINWQNYQKPNLHFTTNWNEVVEKQPYDLILMFDVLDHIIKQDPVDILKNINSVLKDDGKIYIRTHPITSRHAIHHYHDLNKAYIHLVFTPEELKTIVPQITTSKFIEPCLPIIYPKRTYEDWFKRAGFKIEYTRETTELVEPLFKTPLIAKRIMNNLGIDKFPDVQMTFQFIDYVLAKAD